MTPFSRRPRAIFVQALRPTTEDIADAITIRMIYFPFGRLFIFQMASVKRTFTVVKDEDRAATASRAAAGSGKTDVRPIVFDATIVRGMARTTFAEEVINNVFELLLLLPNRMLFRLLTLVMKAPIDPESFYGKNKDELTTVFADLTKIVKGQPMLDALRYPSPIIVTLYVLLTRDIEAQNIFDEALWVSDELAATQNDHPRISPASQDSAHLRSYSLIDRLLLQVDRCVACQCGAKARHVKGRTYGNTTSPAQYLCDKGACRAAYTTQGLGVLTEFMEAKGLQRAPLMFCSVHNSDRIQIKVDDEGKLKARCAYLAAGKNVSYADKFCTATEPMFLETGYSVASLPVVSLMNILMAQI